MALQFIYGNPGCGKSEILYEKLTAHAKKDPFQRIFLIVPEQFTLETQKKMVRRSDGHVITNIDVVSFERLAFRSFEEIGMRPNVLEDNGKNLMLRKIAGDHADELTYLRANIRKFGYVEEVKSMLSELMQYAVGPRDLEAILSDLSPESSLHHKLSDILIMYRGMEDRFHDSLLVAEQLPDVLASYVSKIPMLQNAVFAFDGFTGFTPVQEKLINALMAVSSDLYFTVTLDAAETIHTSPAVRDFALEQLFYMSKRMIWDLVRLADQNQISVKEPIAAKQGAHARFAGKQAFQHLEKNLFRPSAKAFFGIQEEIHVTSCANPKEELEYAIYQIAGMVRKEGCRYRDFAIVSANAETYDHYAEGLMKTYGIPYFSDRKRDITYHPLTEAIRALFEIIYSDFSIESVLRLLKTGLMPFTDDEIDLLETYCIARGIRGRKRFGTAFRTPTRQMRDTARRTGDAGQEKMAAQMLKLNDIRKRFLNLILPVCQIFENGPATVRDICAEAYRFLTAIQTETTLASMQEALLLENCVDDASVYDQIWPEIMDLLDKYVTILGEETMDAREYAEILDSGIAGIRIGILPPSSDCVVLGDIERTRLDGVRHLFFLGLNDGVIPQNTNKGGMLSQYDREQLSGMGLRLSPTAREDVFLQRFYLYWNLTKPSDNLFLTYARLDADGKAIHPSYFVSLLSELFPDLEIASFTDETKRIPFTKACGINSWLCGLNDAIEENGTPVWNALHHWFSKDETEKERIRSYLDIRFAGAKAEILSLDTARLLYGTTISNSVSRLENFIRCPYRHFLDYGLRLSERETFQVTPVDLGSFMHDVLARFSKKVDAGSGWMQIERSEWETCLTESILESELGQSESVFYDNATSLHRLDVIRQTLLQSTDALIRQIRAGSFLPADYETGFRLRYGHLILNGRIDRCDLYQDHDRTWIRVIDYKSGATVFKLPEFYHGLSLQLVLYLEAVTKRFADSGKTVLPGGMFYYHLDDPVIDLSDLKKDESIEDALFAAYKLNGLVNSDEEVYRNMDSGFEKQSKVIPVTLKKEGDLAKSARVTDEEGFLLLRKHAMAKCRKTGDRILSGEIAPVPFELNDQNGCKYCNYHEICGFDQRIPGYHKNELENLDDDEIWTKLKEAYGEDKPL
ncbi:MAG: hypothetical protein E7236_02005 [Lachnospiraceae bacterium]|nr:hypothetical protein [Lachnospiraceae bacterium]